MLLPYSHCISIKGKDVEHIFKYLLAIRTSFEKCLFSPSAHLLIGLFLHFAIKVFSSFCMLDINPLSSEYLAKNFFNSVGCLFT
jgi:hypothetical protein